MSGNRKAPYDESGKEKVQSGRGERDNRDVKGIPKSERNMAQLFRTAFESQSHHQMDLCDWRIGLFVLKNAVETDVVFKARA